MTSGDNDDDIARVNAVSKRLRTRGKITCVTLEGRIRDRRLQGTKREYGKRAWGCDRTAFRRISEGGSIKTSAGNRKVRHSLSGRGCLGAQQNEKGIKRRKERRSKKTAANKGRGTQFPNEE